MKIGGYSGVSGSRLADRSRETARTGKASAASSVSEVRLTGNADLKAVEVSDLFGVPESEMTPKVREAIMGLMEEVDTLRHELHVAHRKITDLEELADRDTLTPLANRRAFVREVTRMISYTDRYDVPSSLVFFDVNGLKQINDTLGHAAGDKTLIAVADSLIANTRDTDIVGRLGGDEFGVILAQADEETSRIKADALAEAIREQPIMIGDKEIHIEVAHGVFPFKPGHDASAALAEADKRMYHRKQEMKAAREDSDASPHAAEGKLSGPAAASPAQPAGLKNGHPLPGIAPDAPLFAKGPDTTAEPEKDHPFIPPYFQNR